MTTKRKLHQILLIFALATLIAVGCVPIASASPAPNPNKLPRMVTMSFFGTDGTQMAFNWNTTDFCDSDVQVVEATVSGGFNSASVVTTQGTYHTSQASNSDGYIHRCVVSNLKLNTKYLYRVGDKELDVWSQVGSFTTEAGASAPFTFVHVSDPQATDATAYETYKFVLAEAAQHTDPRFFVNTGDIVNNNWLGYTPNLQQWEWALTDTFDVTKDYPQMATAGNHEAADYDFASRFNYDVPANADTKSGCYYSFNYNGVHFVALNTNDTTNPSSPTATGLSTAQLDWIRADLEANKNAKWKVVLMHKAMYDCGDGGNNTLGTDYDVAVMKTQLAPLFSQYGVDLVLQGHDHLYSLSYPLTSKLTDDGDVQTTAATTAKTEHRINDISVYGYTNPNGTLYLNSGTASGFKTFKPVANYPTELIDGVADGTLMYSAITVDGNNLVINVYTLDGNFDSVLFDSVCVVKNANAPVEPTPNPGGDGGNNGGGNQNNGNNDGKNNLPPYAIALVAVGGALVVAAVVTVVLLALKKRKQAAASVDQSDETTN